MCGMVGSIGEVYQWIFELAGIRLNLWGFEYTPSPPALQPWANRLNSRTNLFVSKWLPFNNRASSLENSVCLDWLGIRTRLPLFPESNETKLFLFAAARIRYVSDTILVYPFAAKDIWSSYYLLPLHSQSPIVACY